MKNIMTQFKVALIAVFAVLFFVTVHGAQAATLYWYSTGDTSWTSTTNWYTDSGHTSPAGAIPTSGDSAELLGAVAPVFNLDDDLSYTQQPSSMDSTGLTGAANISGVIFTSVTGRNWNGSLAGNATFSGYSFNSGNVYGNAIFNNFSHNLNHVSGDATFNNFAYNASGIDGFVTFNDNSYNYSTIGSGAVFNDSSYNYNGSIYGAPATFNGNSHNIQGYMDYTATFNDNSYDSYGSYANAPTYNNTNQQFVFNAAEDNDWSNPNNWIGGVVPGPNDDVYIINQVISNGAGSDVVARSAMFYGYDALWATGGTFTVTDGVTFSNSAHNASGTIVGTTTFDFAAFNQGTITGTAIFNNYSYNEGTVNGDVTFSYYSNNNNSGSINGPSAVFVNNSYNNYSAIASPTVASFLESYSYGDTDEAHFYRFSNNYGTVSTTTDFHSGSSNQGSVIADAYFYDSAYNNGYIDGSGYFVGDNSENNGTVTSSLVRKYVLDITTSRDFTSGGYWTVVADGAVVDVSGSAFNIHTTFQEVNGGSFIGAGGFPGVTINSPTEGSTISTWSPSVAWHKAYNDYVTCQYSYDTNVWFGASCVGNGSDIVATTTYGSQTLTIRATDSNAEATTSAVTYNYTPARLVYFYSNGSDPSWTTAGNWYTNAGHTVPAGSVPASIDNVTVVGSTAPQVDLDTWVQPTNIYTPTGIVFTSASSASTTARITGPATFNNSAKNNGRITGNAIFNNTSSNDVDGRIVGNATFSASSTNEGTVVLNATFYADISDNTGTVSGVKSRYYNATTTTTRDFTDDWTVVADGVTVNVASSTYSGTTKFKTLNGGYFLGGPTAVYWSGSTPGASWTNTTNWYSDSTATTHINRVASTAETVIVVGSTTPQVDLDDGEWVVPAGIDASLTGIIFTSLNNYPLSTSVTGSTTLNGNIVNYAAILGDVTFNGTTLNTSYGIISGSATFNTNSSNYGLVTGDAVFNGGASNRETGVIYGSAIFNDSSANTSSENGIFGTAYFYSTSYNGGTIDNDAYFYNDLSEDSGTILGTKTRYYTEDSTTTLDFVATGPWTLVADGVTVHLDDTAVFASTTVFTEVNGGNFTGNSVPGSYTDCTKPLVVAGTYTFQGNVTNTCDIQVDGVTLNGGGYRLGPPEPTPFPNNSSNSGWFDMTGNLGLYHFEHGFGPIIDSSGNGNNGTFSGSIGLNTLGAMSYGSGYGFVGAGYVTTPVTENNVKSISFWFNENGDDGYANDWEGVISSTDDINTSGQGFNFARIIYNGQKEFYFMANDAGGFYSAQINIPPGNSTWRHGVIVRDNSNVYIYINGVLTNTFNNHSWSGSSAVQFGRGIQGNSKNYKGYLDEIALWDRTLSGPEILSIYNAQLSSSGSLLTSNNHSFNLSNITVSGSITSEGATLHLTNATTSAINVTGTSSPGNGQDGGTITLVNSHTGALTANGGDSTDYGYGGSAGSITLDGNSSASSQTANAGYNGPNLGAGQQSGGNSGGNSSVRGCTDPSATNYNASATVYDGSCRYAQVTVRGCTNPSATNYNANATVNDGSCTYPSYNTVNPSSNSGGGNSNSQNNNNPSSGSGTSISGVNLELKKLRQLLLNSITGVTPVITNSTGVTNFGNVLAGFNPIGQLNLTPLNFEFAPTVSAFLFAPLPEPIASAVKNFPKLSSLLASVGVSREQDLVTLMNNPVLLPEFTESDMAPGIFLVVGSSSKPLKAYLASDPKHRIVESVNASPGETLTVSLIPLSKGKVQAVFGDEIVDFFASKQKAVYAVITVPKTPGKYFLITKSAPFPLAINIVAPPEPVKPQKLTFIQRVIGWFGKLLR